MRRSAALLAAALSALGAPARAEGDGGCAIALAHMNADGIGTYTAECRWPVAPSFVAGIVGVPERIAAATRSIAESIPLPDGRLVHVISPGWPIDDRQSTLSVVRTPLPDGGLQLTYSLASIQEPLGRGRVQTRRDDGRWEIRSDGNGGTRLRYANTFDAGGRLPASLVQRAVPQRMAKSLAEVRAAAEASARAERSRDAP